MMVVTASQMGIVEVCFIFSHIKLKMFVFKIQTDALKPSDFVILKKKKTYDCEKCFMTCSLQCFAVKRKLCF